MNESNPPVEKAEGTAGLSKRPRGDPNNNKNTKSVEGQDESRLRNLSNVDEDAGIIVDLTQDVESPEVVRALKPGNVWVFVLPISRPTSTCP